MRYFYITGTSSGIGKALTLRLLKDPNNRVFGFGRSNVHNHPNYTHIIKDLSKIKEMDFHFGIKDLKNADTIALVNNSGTLDPMKYAGKIQTKDIQYAIKLNFMAPAVMTNNFIKETNHLQKNKVILNVSSGAASYPVDGWMMYCSTKSALEMLSKVVNHEAEMNQTNNLYTFSVAPGIVETNMQQQIRSTEKENFSRVAEFIQLKKDDQLFETSYVAEKFYDVLINPEKYREKIFRLS